ncbi:spore coat protein [Mesobacillus foraminis]|uniref:spore coat protein n=1 Tax=Mesobacillus foraminis TaxID=279826 RepID=UPI001BE4E3BA|nr:spore coat protein [Mesobacillus foraminis]MBT2755431.1 spore coat protein [Mesobacillus foraminis]
MNFAAHELLETSEALRSKAALIEEHGVFAAQCKDQQLKSILMKHQQQMSAAYQQGVQLMQGRGAQVSHQAPNFHMQDPNIGMNNQATMGPMTNSKTLSDQTIATLALMAHKSGSVMGMQWANECVDANLRMYHVNGANLCQEMAYEMWNWMNHHGYYQPPAFHTQQVTQMGTMFQSMGMQQMGSLNDGTQGNMNMQ